MANSLKRLESRCRSLELLVDDLWWVLVRYNHEMSFGSTVPSEGLLRAGERVTERRFRLCGKVGFPKHLMKAKKPKKDNR